MRKFQFHLPTGVAVPEAQQDDGAHRPQFHPGITGTKSVLKTGRSKGAKDNLPLVPGFKWDFAEVERLSSAPAVPLIARDAFVSDMSVKVDQLQIEIRALARDMQTAKITIGEMKGELDGNRRFLSFQDGEQRARNTRFEELLRKFRDLKARVDAIDGKCKGDFQSFESLESISRRITELGSLQRDFRGIERKLRWSAALFCGSVALWLVTFLSG